MEPHATASERINAAEKFVRDLSVEGDVLIDNMNDSFCSTYEAWPAQCFVVKSGVLVFQTKLFGFKNEEKALSNWLEENVNYKVQTVKKTPKEIKIEDSKNARQNDYIHSLRMKTVVVGDKSCGKTCLYNRFAKGFFPTSYIPSVFEHYVADLEVDGRKVKLALWDTCAGEEYARLRPLSYPDTDFVLLMFAFGSSESLQNCFSKWAPELRKFCPGIPIILVGGQKDVLEVDAEKPIDAVTSQQGQTMAETIGAAAYFECSSKTGEGVEEVFTAAIRNMMKMQVYRCKCKQGRWKQCCSVL